MLGWKPDPGEHARLESLVWFSIQPARDLARRTIGPVQIKMTRIVLMMGSLSGLMKKKVRAVMDIDDLEDDLDSGEAIEEDEEIFGSAVGQRKGAGLDAEFAYSSRHDREGSSSSSLQSLDEIFKTAPS